MDNIKSRRRRSLYNVTGAPAGDESELMPSPEELINSLGPDAFGKKEPVEGARVLHKKLTDFADQSPELSPELVSEEAPEAFFLSAETKLKDVEEDLGSETSKATYDERREFGIGVNVIHALFAGEEIPSYSPTDQIPDEAALEREMEQKIAQAIKQFPPPEPSA